jgi:RNA polymerase sigma-70 factor (ECF subfamily)
VPGFVEARPAILVYNPANLTGPPAYFVLIEWRSGRLIAIRDFLYAPYVMEGAEVQPLT